MSQEVCFLLGKPTLLLSAGWHVTDDGIALALDPERLGSWVTDVTFHKHDMHVGFSALSTSRILKGLWSWPGKLLPGSPNLNPIVSKTVLWGEVHDPPNKRQRTGLFDKAWGDGDRDGEHILQY